MYILFNTIVVFIGIWYCMFTKEIATSFDYHVVCRQHGLPPDLAMWMQSMSSTLSTHTFPTKNPSEGSDGFFVSCAGSGKAGVQQDEEP